MRAIPVDPFALIPSLPLAIGARRALSVSGAAVELLWLPDRRRRQGRPRAGRRPFVATNAPRIIADESIWRGGGIALTPNRHPFAERHLLLWSIEPRREPDREMLEVGIALAEQNCGSLLINSVGAAASIPWAHAHLVGEGLPFLAGLPLEPVELELLEDRDAVDALCVSPKRFPAALIALRGSIEARAAAAERLIRLRSCAAFSLVASGGTCWLMPRGAEFPVPHFPQALGSAELWGRWCYDDEDAFRLATAAMLERALGAAGLAPETIRPSPD